MSDKVHRNFIRTEIQAEQAAAVSVLARADFIEWDMTRQVNLVGYAWSDNEWWQISIQRCGDRVLVTAIPTLSVFVPESALLGHLGAMMREPEYELPY